LPIIAIIGNWFAVVEYYVAWFNNERLHEALGDRPPREIEDLYAAKAGPITPTWSKLGTI
jgi:transposase InsO family protein